MIIDLRSVSHSTRDFEFRLEKTWIGSAEQHDQMLEFDAPLEVSIELYQAGEKYVLAGNLQGGLRVQCDRCLEFYHMDLRHAFKVLLTLPLPPGEKDEAEPLEEDTEIDVAEGGVVDLEKIVREQIYLFLPMRLICKEHCLGLCPTCGSNLNEGVCRCPREKGHGAFLKLKNLNFKEIRDR